MAVSRNLLADWKDAASTLQSLVTILALIIGGWWTLRFFDFSPEINIKSDVHFTNVNKDNLSIHVTFTLENTGKVNITIPCIALIIQRLNPLTVAEVEKLTQHESALDTRISAGYIGNLPLLVSAIADESYDPYRISAGQKISLSFIKIVPEVVQGTQEPLKTIGLYAYFQHTINGDTKCRLKPNAGLVGPGWPATGVYSVSK